MSHDRILVMDEAGGPESFLVQLLWRRGYDVRWAVWPADTCDFAGWVPDEIIVALDGWEGRAFRWHARLAARLYPHRVDSWGFFVARLRRA